MVVKPSMRTTTYRSYNIDFEKHLKTCRIANTGLRDIDEAQIQHLFVTENKAATRTQALTLIVLRRALDRAVQWQLIDSNPAKGAAIPRQERHPLSPEEVQRFLTFAKNDPLFHAYFLALNTGMRQSELLALRWEDIVNGTIRVNRALDPHTFKAPEPKTRAGKHAIVLDARALAMLEPHKGAASCGRLYRAARLCRSIRRPLAAVELQRRSFKPLLKKAGISETIRFHDHLRHTSATLMLAAGVNLKIASERLGHANIAITGDFYQRVSTDMQRDVARKMGNSSLLTTKK